MSSSAGAAASYTGFAVNRILRTQSTQQSAVSEIGVLATGPFKELIMGYEGVPVGYRPSEYQLSRFRVHLRGIPCHHSRVPLKTVLFVRIQLMFLEL